MIKPTLHLIHGYIASGKTTYAKRLEIETGAIRFTLDEWMSHFYGANPPAENFGHYQENIKAAIWPIADKFLMNNVSVILDYGFWKRSDRDEYRKRAEDLNVNVHLHSLRLDDETALARLKTRTNEMPNGALYIDENAYHSLKGSFEPLENIEVRTDAF